MQVLRVLRVARVLRILRLLKNLKGLRDLVMTLVAAFPSLINVGAVLGLVVFMCARGPSNAHPMHAGTHAHPPMCTCTCTCAGTR